LTTNTISNTLTTHAISNTFKIPTEPFPSPTTPPPAAAAAAASVSSAAAATSAAAAAAQGLETGAREAVFAEPRGHDLL